MPSFTFFTSQQASGILANMGTDIAASAYVAQGAVVASTDNASVIAGSGSHQVVTIAGQVWSQSNNTISLLGENAKVSVLPTGSILNSAAGPTAAIFLSTDISSSNTLNNAGQIDGGSGVLASGNFNILNSGRIVGHGGGGPFETSVSAPLLLQPSPSVPVFGQIDNTGTIEGSVQATGNFLAGKRIALMETNISGDSTVGYALTINNSGSILGDLILARRVDVVKNTGLIDGNVDTGADNDSVKNSGTITGDVLLGAGDDTYDGRNGSIDGVVFGGADDDKLYTGAGDDTLNGDSGSDTLAGGAGADILNGGSGTDRASYSTATAAVTANLLKPSTNKGDAKGDTYSSIEELRGSGFDDTLTGNSSANTIFGGDGDDTINGGRGNDTLSGGNGDDSFVFNATLSAANVDTITDFDVAEDTIRIDNAVFVGLSTGTLASSAFKANTSGNASDASDRIIYETDTGNLYFDADGNGAGAKIHFATIDVGLALTNSDFVVI